MTRLNYCGRALCFDQIGIAANMLVALFFAQVEPVQVRSSEAFCGETQRKVQSGQSVPIESQRGVRLRLKGKGDVIT